MEPKTIEGTWEEVSQRAKELAGRRVRVTVLDEPETSEADAETAFDLLARAGLIGCIKGAPGGPTDLATNPSHMEGFGGE